MRDAELVSSGLQLFCSVEPSGTGRQWSAEVRHQVSWWLRGGDGDDAVGALLSTARPRPFQVYTTHRRWADQCSSGH